MRLTRMVYFGVVLVLAVLSLPGMAAAQDGAVIETGWECYSVVPDRGGITTNESREVITPSGNAMITCHFTGPAVTETVVEQGFNCATALGTTTASHSVYTKPGKAALICRDTPGT
jgi:hypothetical protein